MRAAVTDGVGSMVVVDRPDPGDPGPGEVLVVPEAVGICGSDYSFFSGHLSEAAGGSSFPRVQGHEVGARIAAVGAGCRDELEPGMRVALMPLSACGHCYPCGVGRENVCVNFRLIGIHVDGGLQGALRIGQDQVFVIDTPDGALAAMTEPVSVAMRAVRAHAWRRARMPSCWAPGRSACAWRSWLWIEGAVYWSSTSRTAASSSPAASAPTRCASPTAPRWWPMPASGAAAVARRRDRRHRRSRRGPRDGRHGSHAGRAVQVGMSVDEVSLRIGSLTEKELDLLGVCCMSGGDFGEAVAVVSATATRCGPDQPPVRARAGAGGDPVRDRQSHERDEGGDRR